MNISEDGYLRNSYVTLTPYEQTLIRNEAILIEYPQRQFIFQDQDPPDYIYFIQSGYVKIYRISSNGKVIVVGIRKPGELIGLCEVLSGMPRHGFAETVDSCVLWKLDGRLFIKILHSYSPLAVKVATALGNRLREVETQLSNIVWGEVDRRLAKLLINLAYQGIASGLQRIPIAAPLTHQDLATMIGSSRPTVTSLLQKFKDAGLISVQRKRIKIIDLDGLRRYADN